MPKTLLLFFFRRSARKSHTKATRKKLRALDIKLIEVPRCAWGKT